MTKAEMREVERCEAGCQDGYFPCPHDVFDDEDWCVKCDTPADEPSPMMTCETCW